MATKRAVTPGSYNVAEMAAAELGQGYTADSRRRLRALYLSRVAGRTGRRLRILMDRHTRQD